jgi:hypothetical protein
LGNIELEKAQTTLRSIAVKSSTDTHEITPNRCRARKISRGFYFDPVTFDATVTSTKAVFAGAESPEKDDIEGVDEVSFDFSLRNTANSRSFRSICWSSYCDRLINALNSH